MQNNNLILSLAVALLLAAVPAKAQTNEVQLDEDGIMRVGAPVTIVTIGNSITAGYSNTSPYQIFDFDEKMAGKYIGTYTNEAGCREQLVLTLTLKPDEK